MPFQQSSLPLWPGHDFLSAFFTSGNLLSTFVTVSGHGQVILRGLDRFESVEKTNVGKCRQFGIGFPYWICYFHWICLFVVAISCGCSCSYWTISMDKMHLCSSRDHHSRRIDRICVSNHVTMHVHRCASMCCYPTSSSSSIQEAQPLPVLHVASSPLLVATSTISSDQNLWIASNAHAAIAHEPNSSVDLANKTWKTPFVRYKVAITTGGSHPLRFCNHVR